MEAIAKSEFYRILSELDENGVRKTAKRYGRSLGVVSRINAAKRCIDRGDAAALREALDAKRTSKTFYLYALSMIRAQEKSSGKPEMLVYSPMIPVANELIKTMNECMALLSEIIDTCAGKE